MKILLINPPTDNIIKTELPEFIRSEVGIFPPLGLMYIASYVKKYNPHHEVRILDSIAEGMHRYKIKNFVSDYLPDAVGITTYTHNLLDVLFLINDIKDISSNIHITLGGAHVNIFPEESIKIKGVDSVVLAEGEIAFSELIDCLYNKDDLSKVHGILFKDNGNIMRTQPRRLEKDLDIYPYPEREIIVSNKYKYVLDETSGKITTMVSSRGCPYNCSFCSTPRGTYRVRSPKNIVDEMENCLKFGTQEIHFVDDNFGFDTDHALEICKEINRRNLNIKWGIKARIDRLNRDLIYKFKRSGCNRINFGVETSTDEGLKILKKGITIKQIKDAFRWSKEAKINTVAYFMLGCPHEKIEFDIKRTVDFAIELDPDYAMFNLLTLYPGTELYEEGIKKGLIKSDCWREFALSPKRDFLLPFWEEFFSKDELINLLIKAYRRFYIRPKFICRILKNQNGLKKILNNVKIGINILFSSQ